MEPVTVRAAPQKVSFMLSRIKRFSFLVSRFSFWTVSSPRLSPYPALRCIPDWSRAQRLLNSGWMLRKLTALGVFVLALAPSAYLAWTLRAMPHLGFYHDDSIYWVSAKSLAEGHEYRIASLPGQPYQTKYPPLYPALLAGIWKIDQIGRAHV